MTHPPALPPNRATSTDVKKPNPARRTGKIARLPCKIRDELNCMLSDGTPYSVIAEKLAANGHHLNESNISRWFSGGHQDWLKEQAFLDEMRTRLDFASELLNKPNSQLLDQASLRIAVLRLSSLLADFDPALLKPKLADNPATYPRLLNSLCKLTQCNLSFERHRLDQKRGLPFDE